VIAPALLAVSALVHAQAPQGDAKARRFDCSQAKDPKACEERQAKVRAALAKAQKACEGKPADAQRSCVQREMCAQASDPKACESRIAQREKIRAACKDKKGEEHRACLRQQRSEQRGKT
jgi:hypothetical protein